MRRPRRSSRPRRRAGFTLLEALIAMSILGVGLLALAAMQLFAMRGGESGRRTTEASAIAQDRMERLERVTWSHPDLAPSGGWKPADTESSPGQSGVEYTVTWRVSDVVAGSTRSIDVLVTWDEPQWGSRSLAISSMRFNREAL
jgi:prepilin-type N-terminal cleavage/methylation domain-containing protein